MLIKIKFQGDITLIYNLPDDIAKELLVLDATGKHSCIPNPYKCESCPIGRLTCFNNKFLEVSRLDNIIPYFLATKKSESILKETKMGMTRKEYIEFHAKKMEEMKEITLRKNADYSGASDADDPFANFRICELLGLCSTEIGMLVRMSDKMARIATFAKKGELLVKDESVEDTLSDLSNYSVLLAGYLHNKKTTNTNTNTVAKIGSSKPSLTLVTDCMTPDDVIYVSKTTYLRLIPIFKNIPGAIVTLTREYMCDPTLLTYTVEIPKDERKYRITHSGINQDMVTSISTSFYLTSLLQNYVDIAVIDVGDLAKNGISTPSAHELEQFFKEG